MKIKYFRYLYFSLFVVLLSLLCAAMFHRPMAGEGSTWYLQLVSHHKVFYDDAFYRYVDLLVQLPSFLVLSLPYNMNKFAVYLLNFAYSFHPLVSLFFSYKILNKKNRLDLFIFPVLSFATATLATLPHATLMAADALSVFWPLFLLILLYNNSRAELVAIVFLFTILIFSYEPAVLFFILIILISLRDLLISKNNRKYFNYLMIFLGVLGATLMLYVIFSRQHATPAFYNSLFTGLDAFRIFGIISILIFSGYLVLNMFGAINKKLLALLFWSGFSVNFFWFLKMFSNIDLGNAYRARTTALPVAVFLAFITFLYRQKHKNSNWICEIVGKNSTLFVAAMVLAGALHDIKITYLWKKNYDHFESYVKNNSGCNSVNIGKFGTHFSFSATPPYAFAAMSILIQIVNDVEPIKSIVFLAEPESDNVEKSACDSYSNGEFISNQGSGVAVIPSFLEFSEEIYLKKSKEIIE